MIAAAPFDHALFVLRHARAHWLALLLSTACGGSGEAADPSEVLGDDLAYRGVQGGSASQQSPAGAETGQAPASRDECKRAAQNLVQLGYDLAIDEEADPDKKQRLRDERDEALRGQHAAELVDTWTEECLERGDSRAVTACLATVKHEQDIERCDPGP